MTAEIAVLNKTAVALATDSAITISAGNGNQALKIFETADKLFEMSASQPIGVMIYNGMQFLGVPLEAIVKGFRQDLEEFETVKDAAEAFLRNLYDYVDGAPDEEIYKSIQSIIGPVVEDVGQAIQRAVLNRLQSGEDIANKEKLINASKEVVQTYKEAVEKLSEADLLPRNDDKAQPKKYAKLVRQVVETSLAPLAMSELDAIVDICTSIMASEHISTAKTGLVFAGFGENETFPTLISFEIDGVFEAKIRHKQTEFCDIDRNGVRAFVRPFAQKEMVDRFLHGLDDPLRSDISRYCEKTVSHIADGLIDTIAFANDEDRKSLVKLAREAETVFLRKLNDEAFTSFQGISRRQIEDMVEFMPKPELARMAEALIDLTSIKRKVSQGLETVGGPVDVALISKYDGFVWVKRKHYFPADLNMRYTERIRRPIWVPTEGGEHD